MRERLQTCRFCRRTLWPGDSRVKYSTRHYAHHRCYIEAGKDIDDLLPWQVAEFPYFLLRDYGLLNREVVIKARQFILEMADRQKEIAVALASSEEESD